MPFRQIGRAREGGRSIAFCTRRRLRPAVRRIDRLDRLAARAIASGATMWSGWVIWIWLLKCSTRPLTTRAAPDRQQPLEIIALGVEEDEMQEPGLVAAAHAVGLARIGRPLMRIDRHRDGRDGARRRVRHLGREAAVDDVDRQVPEQIDDMRPGELLEQLAEARPHARQAGDRREQREQDLGAQGRRGCRAHFPPGAGGKRRARSELQQPLDIAVQDFGLVLGAERDGARSSRCPACWGRRDNRPRR